MRLLLLLFLAVPVGAADQIRLPKPVFLAREVAPAPPPPANQPMVLTKELAYVIDSDVPLLVLTSPAGMVKQIVEESPFTIKTWFAANPTVMERKTFKGKHILSLEPVQDGEYELLVMPAQKTVKDKDGKETSVPVTEADVLRQRMKNGTAPRPPTPKDEDKKPVDPKVEPSTSPFPGEGLRVLITFMGDAPLNEAQFNILYGEEMRKWLDANAGKTNYRIWPVTTDASAESELWRNAFARKRDSDLWIVAGNGKAGFEKALPADVKSTIADLTTLLRK